MIQRILIGLALSIPLFAQGAGTPNCQFTYELSNRPTEKPDGVTVIAVAAGAARTPQINNRNTLCNSWYMSVAVDGFSAISLELDDAQNAYTVSGGTPVSWAAFEGTVNTGTNPSTAITSSSLNVTGFYPWLSVSLASSTGTGSIYVTLYGWKSPALLGSSSGGGGSGTVTVVGSGSLASTECVTGGGTQTIQTPSTNCTVDSSGNVKATSISTGSAPPSVTVGTAGVNAASEGTVPTVGATSGVDLIYADSTQHRFLESANNGSYYALAQVIASGTSALGTSSISSATCATVVTTTATGVLATDTITWTPNASIAAVTGYAPVTTGGLSIAAYPTSGNVNFDVCNWSSGSITPGAVTLNWWVGR